MNRHAVLDEGKLWLLSPQQEPTEMPVGFPVTSIDDLWKLAKLGKISHLWVMPGTYWDQLEANLGTDGFDSYITYEDREELCPKFARFAKEGYQFYLGWGHRGRFGWLKVEKPLDILLTISYLRQELGIEVQWSPGHMAGALLMSIHHDNSHRKWIETPTIGMEEIPYNKSARALLFLRPLEYDDVGKYAHCYDKNAADPASCQDLMLGSGDPVHVEFGLEKAIVRRPPREAGIYRVSWNIAGSRFDEGLLPLIIHGEWVTTEILNLAIEEGYDVFLHEGWIFSKSHLVLRPWATRLWEARTHLKEEENYVHANARYNAYWTAKDISVVGVGRLKEIYPHWWSAVVGRSRAIMFYNLIAHEAQCGTPFLIYSDEMHYLSSDPDARSAFPSLLRREDKLGGYKVKYSVICTREMVELSRSDKRHKVGKLQKMIAEMARDGK